MSGDYDATIRAAAEAFADAIITAVRAELARPGSSPSGPAPDRLYSIDEAAVALGLGRTALYAELMSGRLRSFKVGRRRLIPGSAIGIYIEALAAASRPVLRPVAPAGLPATGRRARSDAPDGRTREAERAR